MAAGIGLDTGIAAALVLVALTALAEQLDLVVGRRMRVSLSGPFLVAAALVGGPLVGACAGAATEAFTRDVPRKRVLCAGAGAVQGLAVGLVGEQLSQGGVSGAVVAAAVGLVTGFALNLRLVLRALGPGLRRELRAAWRAIVVSWFLPAPLLVAFLYLFETAPRPRARIRRRPAARRRLGEPAPPPPRAGPCGGTLARAGRRADRCAESLRAHGGAHLRAGTDQARRTDGSALLPRPRPLQDGERHVRLRGRRPAARRRPPPAAQRAARQRPRLPLGWGGVRGARPARRRAPSSPTSPSVSVCSSRPGRSRSTGARARSPAPSERCCSTRRVPPRTPSRRRAGSSRRRRRPATPLWPSRRRKALRLASALPGSTCVATLGSS